ncbi:MAG: hypothetical protein Q8L37_06025 [Candidatus Gottesmanbacteria bacterium]|nr:hypothetical protein [Candidatus Gottesmanbacteria bacterium]
MPPNAHVIIFDDSKAYVETAIGTIEGEGHTIIGSAGSIKDLEKNLPQWAIEFTDVDSIVALIDNQAPWKDDEEPDPKGVGEVAERMIKNAIGQATTIATTSKDSDQVGYGDVRYNRITERVNIGKFITDLPVASRK